MVKMVTKLASSVMPLFANVTLSIKMDEAMRSLKKKQLCKFDAKT